MSEDTSAVRTTLQAMTMPEIVEYVSGLTTSLSEAQQEIARLREQVEYLRICGRAAIDAGERMIATLTTERDAALAAPPSPETRTP
jgi:hypothetical protein